MGERQTDGDWELIPETQTRASDAEAGWPRAGMVRDRWERDDGSVPA